MAKPATAAQFVVAGGANTALRFPGQQHDPASAFNYNYFRDYDPSTGRYVQSDPIGLAGGINAHTPDATRHYLEKRGFLRRTEFMEGTGRDGNCLPLGPSPAEQTLEV